jgi:hypothetical protein
MRLVRDTLVVAPHLGALTTLASALTELTARRGHVHIAVLGEPPPGVDVSAFAVRLRRLTFGYLPPLDRWSHLGMAVRGVLDCWRNLADGTDDPDAFARRLEQAPPLAARLVTSRWLRAIGRRPAARLLAAVDSALPAPPPIVEYLRARNPTLLIVVPMFGVGSFAADYVRAANQLGIATVALPTRWDDLITGGLAHVQPDCVALWNREQRQQAVEVLHLAARRTAVIGACLPLDGASRVTTTRQAFCEQHGVEPGRAVILLAGAEGRGEWIQQCVDGIRASADPRTREAAVMVYWPPPAGVQQHARQVRGAIVIPRCDTAPERYLAETAEALNHADVVIAADMTLVLEAAARARPLVAFLPGDDADGELSRFCASVAPSRGWPRVACDHPALESAIGAALCDGLDGAARAAARTLVRPHGPDLSPGFLMWVRLFAEVVDRKAEPRHLSRWAPWTGRMLAPVASWAASRVANLPAQRETRHRARVLVAAPSAASLFLHQPILRVLAERGHHLSLVFTARRDHTLDAYARIKCDVPNVVQAGVLSPPPQGLWTSVSTALLGMSAYLSMLERRRGGQVPAWLVRLGLTALPAGTRPLARLARQFPLVSRGLRRLVRRFDRALPPSDDACALLRERAPDVLFMLPDTDVVTGLHSAATQSDLLRAASSQAIPTVAVVAGPDAQTHATLLQSNPSLLLVWNDTQREAVIRDLGIGQDRAVAIGAAQLERALNEPPLLDGDAFRARLGLPQGPFAFFSGSVGVLSESRREVDLVRRWIASLRDSRDPGLRDLPVLIRRPVHSPRWRTLDFAGLGPVVLAPHRYERSGELDAVLLAESIRHAAVTIGIDGLSLTMAAAMGKAAIAVSRADAASASDEAPLEMLWKTKGSPVTYAGSLDELNRQLAQVLESTPQTAASALDTIVGARTDARPSAIAADLIEQQARRSQRRTRSRLPFAARIMRVPLLLSAGIVHVTGRVLAFGRS